MIARNNILPCLSLILVIGLLSTCQTGSRNTLSFAVEESEYWWIGVTALGHLMPVQDAFQADMNGNGYGNQIQPLLLSSSGKVIWSESPLDIKFTEGKLQVTSTSELSLTQPGTTLKEAFLFASQNYFPSTQEIPHEKLFTAPQYNTWIELMYNQNQEDILEYAHAIINNGFPPGVLMIDDNWQEDYGKWNFHASRFPDAKGMIKELHKLGFEVMLWICPFVSPDCDVYRELAAQGAFLITEDKQEANSTLPTLDFRGNPLPQMVNWWNGNSAVLDLSNPIAEHWLKKQLNHLQNEYGVDGFKFDAGDPEFYTSGVSHARVSANDQAELFGKIGLNYPLNEYRAMWKMGGQPLVQRLRDKYHNWEDLQSLIPSMLVSGLMGYYYNCPDMIGGGDFTSFLGDASIDQELIVRSAQCHALMPMMQFSVAPWRILDTEHLTAVKEAVALRAQFSDYILREAQKASITGTPIMKPLNYDYPDMEYASLNQQFLIGDSLLVAPVINPNIKQLKVQLPEGKWLYQGKQLMEGPRIVTLSVTLADIPYFTLQNGKL